MIFNSLALQRSWVGNSQEMWPFLCTINKLNQLAAQSCISQVLKTLFFLLASTMGFGCIEILNLGLWNGLFLSPIKFLGWKYILVELKIVDYNLDCYIGLVVLYIQANLPETRLFFVCPNGYAMQLHLSVYTTWDV